VLPHYLDTNKRQNWPVDFTVFLGLENVTCNRVLASLENDLHIQGASLLFLLAGLEPKATIGTHYVFAQLLEKLGAEQL
jgi:hypothetical protein